MMDQGKGLEQARCLMDQYWAATLALRQRAGSEEVHAYRIATRRLLSLLALWRPLIHEPGLERRLMRAAGRLSALRDAQVYAAHFGGKAQPEVVPRVPMLTVRLARWLDRLLQVPADFNPLPLFQMHLALGLADCLAEPGLERPSAGNRLRLRHWHRLRLVLKQTRYGVELLVGQGEGDPAWLSMLIEWQDRLGQLQDARQWRRRLRREKGRDKKVRALREAIRCQLHQLDCRQAELVGLRMALQRQD